jgi:uncharacterized phage infection (PIP) family protein YhgE
MRRVAAAIGTAVLLVAGGCGGGGDGEALSSENYGDAVAEVGDVLEQAFGEVAEEAQGLSGDVDSLEAAGDALDSLAGTVAKGSEALLTAADDLEGLEPPDDAIEANQQLADGLRALAADMDELEAALQDGDFSEIVNLGRQLEQIATSDAGMQIETAIRELESLGYDVEGNDG